MGDFNISIPKLGESIQEGTITKLFVKQGDIVKEEDLLFELATDKVDSEIPSPVSGTVKEILCTENETYPVGHVVMIISMGKESTAKERGNGEIETTTKEKSSKANIEKTEVQIPEDQIKDEKADHHESSPANQNGNGQERFYSPLVKNIAEKEGITQQELDSISGSGLGGRVQKRDVLSYVEEHQTKPKKPPSKEKIIAQPQEEKKAISQELKTSISIGAEDTIMKMDRVRKLIANHMILSKEVSAHVTTVVEADVTNIVLWRNRIKDKFSEKYSEKITYLPIFTEAVARSLAEFKTVNASVDGENIIFRKHINIGIAVARNDDSLIVPVIKDADTKNLLGLTKEINKLGNSARNNTLNPDQLQGGTFTITNFGSFKNIMGTPIINQPQVAILATGIIEKKPSVLETPMGDAIVVRHKMFLSLTYDHRIIDGMLGGKFLRRIADILEQFDINREI